MKVAAKIIVGVTILLLLGISINSFKASPGIVKEVEVLETNCNIEEVEVTVEVFYEENDESSRVEINIKNNTSQNLSFGEAEVYYKKGDKWIKVNSLQEFSLLPLWTVFSSEQAKQLNDTTCDNQHLYTTYLWQMYDMSRIGTYKIEINFMDDEQSEVGNAWIIIEQK